MTTEIAPIEQFAAEIESQENQLAAVLPDHISPGKFIKTVMVAVKHNPEILKCDRESIFSACQKAAGDGLMLDGREGALVPYNTKQNGKFVTVAQYQPMIDGILKKLRNSGELSSIAAFTVCANDPFKYNPAMDDIPNHSPDWFGDRGEMVGVYAIAKLKDGSTNVEIMNLEEIEKIRRTSKGGTDKTTGKAKGVWANWYEQKAKVACIKRLCRRLPSSSDIETLFQHDNENHNPNQGRVIDATIKTESTTLQALTLDPATGEENPTKTAAAYCEKMSGCKSEAQLQDVFAQAWNWSKISAPDQKIVLETVYKELKANLEGEAANV